MSEIIKVSQGKITIPKKIRKKYGIDDGDKLVLKDNGGELVIKALDIRDKNLEVVK